MLMFDLLVLVLAASLALAPLFFAVVGGIIGTGMVLIDAVAVIVGTAIIVGAIVVGDGAIVVCCSHCFWCRCWNFVGIFVTAVIFGPSAVVIVGVVLALPPMLLLLLSLLILPSVCHNVQ